MVFDYCPRSISPVRVALGDATIHQGPHQPMLNDHSTAIALIHLNMKTHLYYSKNTINFGQSVDKNLLKIKIKSYFFRSLNLLIEHIQKMKFKI